MTAEVKEALVIILEAVSSGLSGFLGDPRIQGVLLGALLTQGAALLKDWYVAKMQAEAVRKILALEIDHNLGLLLMFKDIVKPASNEAELDDSAFINFDTDLFLFDFIAYRFHCKAFESQVSLLAKALTEAELASIYNFYSVIGSLTTLFNVVKEEKTIDSLTWLTSYVEALIVDGNPLIGNDNLRIETKANAKLEPTDKTSGTP